MSADCWSALATELPPLDSESDLYVNRLISAADAVTATTTLQSTLPLTYDQGLALSMRQKVIKVETPDETSTTAAANTSPPSKAADRKIVVWMKDPVDPSKLKKYRIMPTSGKTGEQATMSLMTPSPEPVDENIREELAMTDDTTLSTEKLIKTKPTKKETEQTAATKSSSRVRSSTRTCSSSTTKTPKAKPATAKVADPDSALMPPPSTTPARDSPRKAKRLSFNESASSTSKTSSKIKKGAIRNARNQKADQTITEKLQCAKLVQALSVECDFELPRSIRRQQKLSQLKAPLLPMGIKAEPMDESVENDDEDVADEFLQMLPDLMLPPLPGQAHSDDQKPVFSSPDRTQYTRARPEYSYRTSHYGSDYIPLASIAPSYEFIRIPANPLRVPLSPEPSCNYNWQMPVAPDMPPRSLECLVCGQMSSSQGASLRHTAKLHGKTEKKLCCHLCGRCFHHNYRLQQHLIVHSGAQPFACQKCERRFGDKNSLRAHYVRIHEAVRRFQCVKCVMAFKSRRELDLHVARIHDRRPRYFCDACPKQFMTTSDLRDHKLYMHSVGRPFQCNLCDADFKHPRRLKEHLRRMHDQKRPMISGYHAVSNPLLMWPEGQ